MNYDEMGESDETLLSISTLGNVSINIKKKNQDVLKIIIDYRPQSITCLYGGIIILSVIVFIDILTFFLGNFDLLITIVSIIIFCVCWIIMLLYLKNRIEEFIFNKKDGKFFKLKSRFGIKNKKDFYLADIQQIEVEKEKNPWNAYPYKVNIELIKGKKYIICGCERIENANDISDELSKFLETKVDYS